MKEWLYQHEKHLTITNRQLTLLLDSIENDSVGISMPGFFTLNFSLVGTVSETD